MTRLVLLFVFVWSGTVVHAQGQVCLAQKVDATRDVEYGTDCASGTISREAEREWRRRHLRKD